MEVFDQLAQYVCNRYPLNSKWRKQGPSDTLNDVDVPTKHGRPPVKVTINTVGEHKAVMTPYPFDTDPLVFSLNARLVPNRRYESPNDFLGKSTAPNELRLPTHSHRRKCNSSRSKVQQFRRSDIRIRGSWSF